MGEPSRGPCLWPQGASVQMIRTGAPRALGSLNILKSTRAAERPCLARSASPGSRCDIHSLCLMLPYKKRRGAYGKGGEGSTIKSRERNARTDRRA